MEPKKNGGEVKPIVVILILGLIAFILYVVFFINPTTVAQILSKTNLAIYSVAFAAYILFALFSSLTWNNLLSNLSTAVAKRKTLLLTWVGLFFEATVPQLGWSGEVSKTYLLYKDSQIESGTIFASVVGQKIFTLTISAVALGAGLGLALINYPLPLTSAILVFTILAISIIGLCIVLYLSSNSNVTSRLLSWGIRIILFFRKSWNPQYFLSKASDLLENFHLGIKRLTVKPKFLFKPAIYALASFACEVSVLYLVFMALGFFPVPLDKILIVFTLTGTLQTIGITIFGFAEVVMSSSFTFLGIPVDISFSATLLVRVVNLWFRLALSYLALQWAGLKIIRQNKTPK
jgi:uncharacterized protein (TIRG00374 family)